MTGKALHLRTAGKVALFGGGRENSPPVSGAATGRTYPARPAAASNEVSLTRGKVMKMRSGRVGVLVVVLFAGAVAAQEPQPGGADAPQATQPPNTARPGGKL